MIIVEDTNKDFLEELPIGTLFTFNWKQYYLKVGITWPIDGNQLLAVDVATGLLDRFDTHTKCFPVVNAYIQLPTKVTTE